MLRDIVIPQCEKGIVIAFTFAFLITAGDYVTPRFVGGGAAMMGHFIELQFSLGFNWPMGSAMAFTVMAVSLALVMLFRGAVAARLAAMRRPTGQLGDLGWRAFALLTAAFMGAPLVLVVLFSFNQSALTSLPLTGFTLDWYRKLFSLGAFWPALWNSLIVATFVAILSVAIGTMAALVLARMASRRAEILIGISASP